MQKGFKRILFIFLVVFMFILFSLCSLLIQPKQVIKASITNKEANIPAGEIIDGMFVSQTFTANDNILQGFSLYLATYDRQNSGTIIVSIKENMQDNNIQVWQMDVSKLADNNYVDFILDTPIMQAYGKIYQIDITSLDGYYGNAITVWTSENDILPNGELYIDDMPQYGDLTLTVNTMVVSHTKTVYQIMGLIIISLLIFLGMVFLLDYRSIRYISFVKSYMFFALLSIITIYIYMPYLSGDALYVFNDIASDSFEQTIPNYLNIARKLEIYGHIPAWDFSVYLGRAQAPGLNWLNLWPCLFGTEHVVALLGIAQAIKVILAGLLFFIFLKEASFSYFTRVIISIAYAFCGHMIVRGTWNNYPSEVVVVAFALIILEWLYHGKLGGMILPIVVLFLSVLSGLYSVLLYFTIFFAYLLFRYCTENTFRRNEAFHLLTKFALLYVIGVCISSFILIPSLSQLKNSARVVSSIENNGFTDIFKISKSQALVTTYLRTLSSNMQGNPANFYGDWNYLESGTFYCGLLPLLVLPHCFYKAKKKQIMWYAVALLSIAVYCLFENIRLVVNGYANTTFKLSSFFGILILLFLSAKAMDSITIDIKLSYPLLLLSACILIFPAIVLWQFGKAVLEENVLLIVDLFIFAYIILLLFLNLKKTHSKLIVNVLVALFVFEICINSFQNIQLRGTVTREEIQATYQNGVEDLVKDLQKGDMDLFRVDYPSEHLCQPLAQSFMGTRGYVGGSSFSKEINDFLEAIGSSNTEEVGYTRYIYGFTGINEVNTLIGTKYLIYSSQEWPYFYAPYGYKEIENSGYPNLRIFENQYDLPLFFTYDNIMSVQEFLTLTKVERRQALLDAIILEDAEQATFSAAEWRSEQPASTNNEISIAKVDDAQSGSCIYELKQSEAPYLLLNLKVQAKPIEYNTIKELISWGQSEDDLFNSDHQILYVTRIGSEDISVVIPNDKVNFISIANKGVDVQISDVHICALGEEYFMNYRQAIKERKEADVSILSFRQDDIQLKASLASNQYLFFSIPYDDGWQANIDGQTALLEKANIGFMALKVGAGEHVIKLVYAQHSSAFIWGLFGSGILGWLLLFYYKRRKNCK